VTTVAVGADSAPTPYRNRFLRGFLLPYNGALAYRLESITGDDLVLVMPDGTRETWTRAAADWQSVLREESARPEQRPAAE
jgi:hypothetical protein